MRTEQLAIKLQSTAPPLDPWDGQAVFNTKVQRMRNQGWSDISIARQITDDGVRAGYDWTFQQHIIERLVTQVPWS